MKSMHHLGILSAMPQEIGTLVENLEEIKIKNYGDLKVYFGIWKNPKTKNKVKITFAWSGWGKVSAARAATKIITISHNISLPIDLLIFTGVAGGISPEMRQWDIIIPDKVCQYDMDARPIFNKFVIPQLKKIYLEPKFEFHQWAINSISKNLKNKTLSKFGKLTIGLIGTADRFISNEESRNLIIKDLPEIKAVEMEGASVAQVATQEGINWLLIRVISDSANDSAAQNFNEFLEDYSLFSWKIIEVLLTNINK